AAAVVERLSVGASGAGHAAGRTLGWRVHTRRARRRLLLGAIAAVALVAAALGIAWRGRKAAALASAVPTSAVPALAVPALAVLVVPLVALSEDSSDAHLAQG